MSSVINPDISPVSNLDMKKFLWHQELNLGAKYCLFLSSNINLTSFVE